MKFISKLMIGLFVLLAIALLALYLFVETNGKPFLEKQLTAAAGRPVTLSQARFVFPIGLRLDDVAVEGVAQVKEARAYLSLPVVMGRTLLISHVILKEPQIIVRKTARPEEEAAKAPAAAENVPAAQPQPLPGGWDILVDEAEVSGGSVYYEDTSRETPFVMEVNDLSLKARSISYPLRPINASFNIAGTVFGEKIPFTGSRAEAQGWVNWPDKNMDANIVVKEPSGAVGLTADLKSENNDLVVSGTANIDNLSMAPPKKEDDGYPSLESFLLDTIKGSGLKLNASFTIKTKLDDFEVSSIAFSGSVGAGQPGSLKENLKNIGQKFEDLGKQLMDEKQENVNAVKE